jgi:hypothetical protein
MKPCLGHHRSQRLRTRLITDQKVNSFRSPPPARGWQSMASQSILRNILGQTSKGPKNPLVFCGRLKETDDAYSAGRISIPGTSETSLVSQSQPTRREATTYRYLHRYQYLQNTILGRAARALYPHSERGSLATSLACIWWERIPCTKCQYHQPLTADKRTRDTTYSLSSRNRSTKRTRVTLQTWRKPPTRAGRWGVVVERELDQGQRGTPLVTTPQAYLNDRRDANDRRDGRPLAGTS